jgi:two-component system cell cycle sensor histidine kinase/response regulator CckA
MTRSKNHLGVERSEKEKPIGKSQFSRWFRPAATKEGDALAKWREAILFAGLVTGLALALTAFIPAIIVGIREGLWGLVIIDSAVYLGAWCLFIFRRLRYQIRASAAVFLVYFIGMAVCIHVGVMSGGPAYLFTSAVLAGLLIGLKGAVVSVLLNAISIAALGYMFTYGHLAGEHLIFQTPARALAAGASFILLNSVSAISAAVMVRGLHRTTARQAELTEALYRERADLIDARQRLKAENEERRNSEKALRESEAKYRLLTENIHDVIFTLDLEMNYTYVSPAVQQLQGWQPHDMIGANVTEFLPEGSMVMAAETFQAEMALAEATGNYTRKVAMEIELLRKDGTTTWSEITATLLLDEDSKPAAILGVARDISQRREAELEREVLQERLTRSKKMEALGLLAGGVAHDLNNVLSGIVSYPDLLLLDMDDDDPLKKPINTIRSSGQKAAAIVQDLLTLARRGVVTSQVLNLNSLIDEYLQSPEHKKMMSLNHAITVHKDLEEDLPNISGSPIHLKKTLMNLLSNAAEAQPGGGGITIATRSRYLDRPVRGYDQVDAGEYVIVSVSDHGEGIDPVDLPHIFEPFYTKKVMGRSGTGLGMAVVWGTVQDHSGYIDVQSTPGKGTCFTLYFPMTRLEMKSKEGGDTPLDAIKGNGESILVVDDVEEQRTIAQVLLERLNYSVKAVSSGEKAISHIRENPVDLLVLDMIMDPGIDGLDTYRGILVHRPAQKAIIASGYAETSRVRKALSLGAGPYVKKPYTIVNIGKAVQEALKASA